MFLYNNYITTKYYKTMYYIFMLNLNLLKLKLIKILLIYKAKYFDLVNYYFVSRKIHIVIAINS